MPSLAQRFRVQTPVAWFRIAGVVARPGTDTRSGERAYERVDAQPGDEIHLMPTGNFLVRADGTILPGALWVDTPSEGLIASRLESPRNTLKAMQVAGRVEEFFSPAPDLGYDAAKAAAEAVRLPEGTRRILPSERPSAMLAGLLAACEAAGLDEACRSIGAQWRSLDVGEVVQGDPIECRVQVRFPDGRGASIAVAPDTSDVWFRDGAKLLVHAFENGGASKYGFEVAYRNEQIAVVPEKDLANALRAFSEFVRENRRIEEVLDEEPSSPAP